MKRTAQLVSCAQIPPVRFCCGFVVKQPAVQQVNYKSNRWSLSNWPKTKFYVLYVGEQHNNDEFSVISPTEATVHWPTNNTHSTEWYNYTPLCHNRPPRLPRMHINKRDGDGELIYKKCWTIYINFWIIILLYSVNILSKLTSFSLE